MDGSAQVEGLWAAAGCVVGGAIGFLLGLVNGISPLADRLFDTSVQMIRNIPHLAMIPLLLLTFFFGPIGLLLYLGLRLFFRTRTVAA